MENKRTLIFRVRNKQGKVLRNIIRKYSLDNITHSGPIEDKRTERNIEHPT